MVIVIVINININININIIRQLPLANAPINVKPDGGRRGADVGHLTFCDIFLFTLGMKMLVKIDQISPPEISAEFFSTFSWYLQHVCFPILQNI